jgi:hypothetical protein
VAVGKGFSARRFSHTSPKLRPHKIRGRVTACEKLEPALVAIDASDSTIYLFLVSLFIHIFLQVVYLLS